MGNVIRYGKRVLQRYNIEERAQKVITQEKRSAAPRYKSSEQVLKKYAEEHPELMQDIQNKGTKLNEFLKDVYVTSKGPPPVDLSVRTNPDRPLPMNRTSSELPKFGYTEPDRVPPGKTSIQSALQFLGRHRSDPNTWTVGKIAEEYKLHPRLTENVLTYFHIFEIHLPQQEENKLKYSGMINALMPELLPEPEYLKPKPNFGQKSEEISSKEQPMKEHKS